MTRYKASSAIIRRAIAIIKFSVAVIVTVSMYAALFLMWVALPA